jgi:ribosomal protein S18 acetylase RimI-like enzyme
MVEMMLTIRRLRPDEGLRLRAIRLEALADSPSAFGSTFAETLARPPEYWERRAADNASGEGSVLFIAEGESGWYGLAGAYLDEEDPDSADLISMWVRPAYRGKGLGERLVAAVIAWARERGLQQVALWVTQTNTPAIALYERCGFRHTNETQPLPSNPEILEQRLIVEVSEGR